MYHITCTRLSAVAATSGSLAALGDIIISQLTFCSESKVNGVIGASVRSLIVISCYDVTS